MILDQFELIKHFSFKTSYFMEENLLKFIKRNLEKRQNNVNMVYSAEL